MHINHVYNLDVPDKATVLFNMWMKLNTLPVNLYLEWALYATLEYKESKNVDP